MLTSMMKALFALIIILNTIGAVPTINKDTEVNSVVGIESIFGATLPTQVCELSGTSCVHGPDQGIDPKSAIVTHILGRPIHRLCTFNGIKCKTVEVNLDTLSGSIIERKLIYGAPWSSCGPPGAICAFTDSSVEIPSVQTESDIAPVESDAVAHTVRALIYGAPWSSCGPPGAICAFTANSDQEEAPVQNQTTSQLDKRELQPVGSDLIHIKDTGKEQQIMQLAHTAPLATMSTTSTMTITKTVMLVTTPVLTITTTTPVVIVTQETPVLTITRMTPVVIVTWETPVLTITRTVVYP